MKAIRELLNRRWILKRRDPELYFEIKDQVKGFGEFFKEKLGYALIINPIMIKLEKLPGKAQPWMGIHHFETQLSYVFFCLLLMFLEDREPEEQFILSQITDYIKAQPLEGEAVDWTVYQQRRALIKVLEFCKEEGLIEISDGDDSAFVSSEGSVEVLYENTGASKYFVRRFPFDITQVNGIKAFEQVDWQSDDADRGIIRRYRVYRRLLIEPVVYQQGSEDQDFLYIKNMRSVLAHDFDHYLEADLQVHKNCAMLIFHDGNLVSESLPNRKNSSDIVLQCTREIRLAVSNGTFERQSADRIHLSSGAWSEFLDAIRAKYGAGWSKGYRELSSTNYRNEINTIMMQYGMIEIDDRYKDVFILSAAAKMVGDYPDSYWESTEATEKNSNLSIEADMSDEIA